MMTLIQTIALQTNYRIATAFGEHMLFGTNHPNSGTANLSCPWLMHTNYCYAQPEPSALFLHFCSR